MIPKIEEKNLLNLSNLTCQAKKIIFFDIKLKSSKWARLRQKEGVVYFWRPLLSWLIGCTEPDGRNGKKRQKLVLNDDLSH